MLHTKGGESIVETDGGVEKPKNGFPHLLEPSVQRELLESASKKAPGGLWRRIKAEPVCSSC
jgi:hypothetical protein